MRDLIINNKLINTPILNILKQVKSELTNNKLKDIVDKHDSIRVTCPHHKMGLENHPSCGVYAGGTDNDIDTITYGSFHCFTCGFKGSLGKFIGECFDMDEKFGNEWLVERFGNHLVYEKTISLTNIKPIAFNETPILNESILDKFQSYHPYMTQRKLSKDVIEKFKIKYDPESQCIIFPVWDENNKLVMLTKRNVNKKHFYINKNIEKPIYLLNYNLKDKVKSVYVCESQINTLTLQSWGYNAIGLFGTGTQHQYNILKQSSINHFILCLDPDEAGEHGIKRFILNMNQHSIIDVIQIPKNKDVNDLTKEEFEKLEKIDDLTWLNTHKHIKVTV